ncbi:hypothetical protein AAG906_020024 [Vitis piasezkii]
MFRDQANVVGQFKPNNNAPYGNTYNSSWRNHPNFSWKAEQLKTNNRIHHLNNLQVLNKQWLISASHDWRKGSGENFVRLGSKCEFAFIFRLSESPIVLATLQSWRKIEEILPLFNKEEEAAAEKETPKLNLKPLPVELKYTYLEENNQCPVVISSSLTSHQENCLMEVLKRSKPIRQLQRRLNPHLQEVVRAEVLKLLQAGIIYLISDSPWVSPTQVVPKKKDHFPLPFIDQVLERVSGYPFYCFLDGYSGILD